MDKSSISDSFDKGSMNKSMKNSGMKGEYKNFAMNSLWVESPCTLSFCSKLPPLQQAKRFHYNSIYYRDNPFAPAKKIDEFQKPDILLSEFRRQIKETDNWVKRNQKITRDKKNKGHLRKSSNNRTLAREMSSDSIEADINDHSLSPNSKQNLETVIVQRLYPKSPKKIRLEYDKYGNRSSFYADESIISTSPNQSKSKMFKSLIQKRKINIQKLSPHASESMFTQSVRMDLSRPQNFNPGPGTYFQNFRSIQNSGGIKKRQKNSELLKIEKNSLDDTSKKVTNIKSQFNRSEPMKAQYKNFQSLKSFESTKNPKFSSKEFPTENSIEEASP